MNLADKVSAEDLEANNRAYYDEFLKLKPGSRLSQDPARAAQLWAESSRLVSAAG